MATADIDQKVLSRLAHAAELTNPFLSGGFYQILGLSVNLSRYLLRARRYRRLDTSRDTRSLDLYLRILWVSREGLRILEGYVLPYTGAKELSHEYRVITAKLIASFYHAICLFNNNPPISQAKVPMFTNSGELMMAMAQSAHPASTRSASRASEAGSTTPTQAMGPGYTTRGYLSPTSATHGSPRAARHSNGANTAKSPPRRTAYLRDPTNSIQSDASFVTNPFPSTTANLKPNSRSTPAPPPGFSNTSGPSAMLPSISPIPHPAGFIMPAQDYLPLTKAHFQSAQASASSLPSNHPLRLSIALEQAAFTWDCLHDYDAARRIARKAVREILQSREGMSDVDFQDAQTLVAALGAVMRRRSGDGRSETATKGSSGKSETKGSSESERKSSSGTMAEWIEAYEMEQFVLGRWLEQP